MKTPDRSLWHGHTETLVLALLAAGEGYGYQLRQNLAVRSRQYLQLTFGRLYPLLRTLEGRGLVTARWVRAGKVRQRRLYAITAKGRRELQERRRQWRQLAAAMKRVLAAR